MPGLTLINLNQPRDVLRDSLPFFAETAAQWPIPPGDGSGAGGQLGVGPFAWMEPLDPRCRVVQEVNAASKEEALELVSEFRRGG